MHPHSPGRRGAATLVVAALAALLALPGCAPSNSGCTAIVGAAELSIGRGDPNNPTTFTGLSTGSVVALTPGNQGGQHIWVQIRIRNMCPERPRVRLQVNRAADNSVIGLSFYETSHWAEVTGERGLYASDPLAASIDADQYCTLLHGGVVQLRVRVDDNRGHVEERDVAVTVDGWVADASPSERAAREACCADYTNTACWPSGPPDAGAGADP